MSLFSAVLAVVLAEAPAEDPPYPHEIPEWYEALGEKLRKPMNFALPQPVSLESALRSLEGAGGVRIRIEEPDEMAGQKKVQLQVSDMHPENVLKLLALQADMSACRVPGGLVVTSRPERYPVPVGVLIRSRLKDFKEREEARERERQMVDALEQKLSEISGPLKLSNIPFEDAIRIFRQISGLNIVLVNEVRERLRGSRAIISGDAKAVAGKEILESFLVQAGLGMDYGENVILITTPENSYERRKAREARREEIRQVRLHAILDRHVDVELRGKRLHEIVEPLRKALDPPVYPGRGAWNCRETIAGPETGKYLWDVARSLRQIGILTIVEPDAVYLLAAEDR